MNQMSFMGWCMKIMMGLWFFAMMMDAVDGSNLKILTSKRSLLSIRKRRLDVQVGIFRELFASKCTALGSGWDSIRTEAECSKAAGITEKWSSKVQGEYKPDWPSGCYKNAWFSVVGGSTFNGNFNSNEKCEKRDCLCTFRCQPGTYQDDPGQYPCKVCSTGQYQNQLEQDSCDACEREDLSRSKS